MESSSLDERQEGPSLAENVPDNPAKEPTDESASDWWSQPCGPAEVLAIALPLVVSTTAWTVMNVTDRVFLFWYSQEQQGVAMTAAMQGGMFLFTLMCFPLGLVAYVNTFVAQYNGAERPQRIGLAIWQAIWIAAACVPLFLLAIPLAPLVFSSFSHEPVLADLEVRYFQVMAWGCGGSILGSALSAFFTGRGETKLVMIVHVSGSLLNIVLDYLWVFGHLGFPEWGLEGAAWATVVSDWFKTILFAYFAFTPENRKEFGLDVGMTWDWPLMRRLCAYGSGNGLHMVVEIGAFTAFLLFMGKLGSAAGAATTMAFNVNSMAFVPMLGIGMAVSTMVGREVGADRHEMAARATWNAAGLALVYTGFFAVAYVLFPKFFLAVFSWGVKPDEFAKIEGPVTILMQFIAVYCLFDALNIIFCNAIRGAGDTNFVVGATFVIGMSCLGVGWYGLEHLGFGLYDCWWVITAWIAAMGVVFTARFMQGAWRDMRVIEPDFTKLADEAA